jgi:hypothetical protein
VRESGAYDYWNSVISTFPTRLREQYHWSLDFSFLFLNEGKSREKNKRTQAGPPAIFFFSKTTKTKRVDSGGQVSNVFFLAFSLLDLNIEAIADAGPLPELNGDYVSVLRIKNVTRYSKRGLKRNQECTKYRDQTKILSLGLSYNTIQLEQPPPRNDFYSCHLT